MNHYSRFEENFLVSDIPADAGQIDRIYVWDREYSSNPISGVKLKHSLYRNPGDVSPQDWLAQSGLTPQWSEGFELVCVDSCNHEDPIHMKHQSWTLDNNTPLATVVSSDDAEAWLYICRGSLRDSQGGLLRRFEFRKYNPSVVNMYTATSSDTTILEIIKY